jgi:hypothetical protein
VSPKATDDTEGLKRLGGGNWQTRDGRFTIESASGTWSLVDAEQTDDLGLPLVRGPFRSLTDAKAAIEEARASVPASSGLAERAGKARSKDAAEPHGAATARGTATPSGAADKPPREPEPPAEPRWLADLDPADRRRARRLLDRLEARGIRDPEGVVRRDLAGDVPAVARAAIADRLAEALGGADAATAKLAGRIVELLADGRDDDLDVRWRLVDDAGRPIGLSADDVAAARKRAEAGRR